MTVSSEQIEDKITDFELFSQFWSVIMTYSYQNNFNIDVENKFWNRYSVPLSNIPFQVGLIKYFTLNALSQYFVIHIGY